MISRTFRRTAGAVTATLAVTLAACGPAGEGGNGDGQPEAGEFEGRGPINYVAGRDVTGTMQDIIDEWNAENPDEEVTYVELPEDPDSQRQQIIQNAQTQADTYGVINVDNVWTAEFAANQWLEPLPEDEFPVDEMLEPVAETARYQDQMYTVPFWTDAGLLYYRTDLLDEAGIDEPPATWTELEQQCDQVLRLPEADGVSCYAGQFEKYEGLTVNFAEAVQSAGGAVTGEDGTPTVDTAEAREGLRFLVEGFESGLIPEAAITYQEEEGRQAFQDGNLLFHRQWPYQYALASADDGSSDVAGAFDVAPLPGADGPGSSSLGGWNLGVSVFAENKATALDFVKYMTSKENQRRNLEDATLAPAYAELYEDPELVEEFPYLPELRESIESAVPRPKVVRYGDATAAIQDYAYAAITGDADPEQALSGLQERLEEITGGQ
ncbi:ABC transporter substrate-binding protein [Haloechinothrix sp. LS1_15]|uniref:ABC transporter substrate-binding protein n=1 Tax=Haloechinothrix sp. LS1_15 TaxID=2652248 RepID=UPI00294B3A06|nr:ABC transporter substrate-binding protein [Haloechinothrix sp. LS1_15]